MIHEKNVVVSKNYYYRAVTAKEKVENGNHMNCLNVHSGF